MFLHVCLCVYVCVCVSVSADVAEWMMNRSVYLCDGAHGEKSGETPIVEYSFQFLEDFKEECRRLSFPATIARHVQFYITNTCICIFTACMHTHTHTPFCRFLRYTAPVSVEPVSLDIANGKESDAGGEDGKTVEEAESTLVATPTSTLAIETAPTTG